ncbi:hypothetical protein BDY17DRAFT_328261 [Neohortaea acidophila]|uniref:WD40-repeat-containing domain protein n=1 Tax=Neohortaea acidophila TaxID=245834 RepID=A0A6A6PFK2_9PEZI|nr:uncharacterized protein BDY17DRAFT_328261 [Neohortaea acidophila]KAF2478740.1 hypothetical protein BDY17DRAFT_328261 [Neohortaea acidophila]
MNRGDLPGYYWDEDKKRYFKIQANHLVPEAAKYAKGNVNQERRISKKRKTETQQKAKRQSALMRKAPVLNSSVLGGTGLGRELGVDQRYRQYGMQKDAALVSQWKAERLDVQLPLKYRADARVRQVHHVPWSGKVIVAATQSTSGHSVLLDYHYDWDEASESVFLGFNTISPITAFNSSIACVSYRRGNAEGHELDSLMIACAEQYQVGNVSFRALRYGDEGHLTCGWDVTLGSTGSSIGDSAFHLATTRAAIIGSFGIAVIDCEGRLRQRIPAPEESEEWPQCAPCVEWLNQNTVLYGVKEDKYSVMLWDTRTPDGKAARFQLHKRLTGLLNPQTDDTTDFGPFHFFNSDFYRYPIHRNPYEILASTNHDINLFDTRMPSINGRDPPVLTMPHVHGGPRLHYAAKGSLIAAVDRDNIVQVYSTRTGAKVSALDAPVWRPRKLESPALHHLSWYDDNDRGSTLLAVQGNGIVRWTWGSPDDE